MTNLFYVSLAYKMAMLQLVLPEVNYVSQRLNLPTPHPIEMVDVTGAVTSPKMKNTAVSIETTNFLFVVGNGKLYQIVNKANNIESFDKYPVWAKTPSLIDTNGAVQLAKQWLASIDIDIGALEKKYGSKMEIEQAFFWDPPGTTNKTMLPIFNVKWDGDSARVRILGTKKELMGLVLRDSSLSRRPSLVLTNAEELNNIPDPPKMPLQRPPSAAPSTTMQTNTVTR